MSCKPELVRPFSNRVPNSAKALDEIDLFSLRSQLQAIRNSKEPITPEEIINLKMEKQQLIQEKTTIKAKISRYNQLANTKKAPARNAQIISSLERQVAALEKMVLQKKGELQNILLSDRAAMITELQEESKIYHLELIRLQTSKRESEHNLRAVDAKLEKLNNEYSNESLLNKKKAIEVLEKEIASQSSKNEALRQAIVEMRQQHEEKCNSKENQRLRQKINDIKEKIRLEQKAIQDIEQEIRSTRTPYARDVQQVQGSL